jgi:hypothetical protein
MFDTLPAFLVSLRGMGLSEDFRESARLTDKFRIGGL